MGVARALPLLGTAAGSKGAGKLVRLVSLGPASRPPVPGSSRRQASPSRESLHGCFLNRRPARDELSGRRHTGLVFGRPDGHRPLPFPQDAQPGGLLPGRPFHESMAHCLQHVCGLFSTNSFLGVTGWVNREDGTIWIGLQNLGILLVVPAVIALYPKIFFRLRLTTAYEYLKSGSTTGCALLPRCFSWRPGSCGCPA